MSDTTAQDIRSIQNTISKYCFALDNKDFGLLSEVFTSDVNAFYPFPGGQLKGVENVAAKIKERLSPITSQHALTTQFIEISQNGKEAGKEASSITYFSGIHFGTKKWEGQSLTAYGRYVDELVKMGEVWKISKREVKFMGRVGEEKVMEPQ